MRAAQGRVRAPTSLLVLVLLFLFLAAAAAPPPNGAAAADAAAAPPPLPPRGAACGWQGEGTCRRLQHSQDGLFTTEQVHDRWPWQEAQIKRLSCADALNLSFFRLAPPLCSPLCPV